MKSFVAALILGVLCGCCGCSVSRGAVEREPGRLRGLTLVYEGEVMGGKVFPRAIFLEDGQGGRTRFGCRDAVSVEMSAFTIRPAWSPGGVWLLVPEGRFDGFAAFKAEELPLALADAARAVRVGVCDVSGTRWWHEFVRWRSASVFEFRAGLSGQWTSFRCDLMTGEVTLGEGERGDFARLPER